MTDEDIAQHPMVDYDMIILREKHLDRLKKAMKLVGYKIAGIEPVGRKRFVLLKKGVVDEGEGHEITHRG